MQDYEQKQPSRISFKFDITSFIGLCGAMYLAYSVHVKNVENTQKVNALLQKYEQTLDAAIAGDKVTLARYQANLEKILNSLTPEERKLMLSLLTTNNVKN